jgi:hypothetical protein
MMRIAIVFWLILGVVFVDVVRLTIVAPFDPSWQNDEAPKIEMRSVRFQLPPLEGTTLIHAEVLRPGYSSVGPFSFGIPTFFDLQDVTVVTRSGELPRSFHCARGRLTGELVELAGPVTCSQETPSWTARSVTVARDGLVTVYR